MPNRDDVLDVSPQVRALLDTEPEPGGHWQLYLKQVSKLDGADIDGRALVDFIHLGDGFAGRTDMELIINGEPRFPFPIDIDGQIGASETTLTIRTEYRELNGAVFECHGEATQSGKVYEGRWNVGCLKPETCGCSGSEGYFELTLVSV